MPMKLYSAPWACSLADDIALREAGLPFETERVDLHSKLTASGRDFRTISAKGYVPALVLESGELITENAAVLDWIAGEYPPLGVEGPLGRTRLLEALVFITTELHGAYKPMWHGGGERELAKARERLAERFAFLGDRMHGDYLFGDRLSAADCYLYVMLRWAGRFGVTVPEAMRELKLRMDARPSVQAALANEREALAA
jgi:glutathione S-transferase